MTAAENIAQLQAILDVTEGSCAEAIVKGVRQDRRGIWRANRAACRESVRLAALRCGARARLNVLRDGR